MLDLPENKLKSIVTAAVTAITAALLAAAPAISFAQQSGAPLTRAQVRQELADLQSVGFDSRAEDASYPERTQQAMQRLAARRAERSAVGAATSGMSEAGAGRMGGK